MKFLLTLYKYLRFWGGSYKCIVCSKQVRTFFPLSTSLQLKAKSNGFPYDFKRMETLNFEMCNCPFCLSSDRERLYLIYLDKFLKDKDKKYSILDFAPNTAFSNTMRAAGHYYTSADLFRTDVDILLDVCDMKEIEDETFDIVICSHVLEHVPDPDKGMREIRRIMRRGGIAIIMVPLFWDVLATAEDKNHTTDALRLRHYGQDDHVRLFSRGDFLNRLNHANFKVTQLLPGDFDSERIKENAIADNSILYISTKAE